MFFLQLLSLLDFLVVFMTAFGYLELISISYIMWVPVYLVGKGIIFFGDMASLLDMCCGIGILLFIFGFKPALLFLFIELYLLQKIAVGFMSG